ncbi:hypothetical protein DFJ77DRAFT_459919 [Powellomyces hirtus]|nr:hypothetical protein DFJ77DRAFT_459919 [Powellomyces hirtus]
MEVTSVMLSRQGRTATSQSNAGFKGVCYHKKARKWIAFIEVTCKQQHLGIFCTAIEAARAYNRAAQKTVTAIIDSTKYEMNAC